MSSTARHIACSHGVFTTTRLPVPRRGEVTFTASPTVRMVSPPVRMRDPTSQGLVSLPVREALHASPTHQQQSKQHNPQDAKGTQALRHQLQMGVLTPGQVTTRASIAVPCVHPAPSTAAAPFHSNHQGSSHAKRHLRHQMPTAGGTHGRGRPRMGALQPPAALHGPTRTVGCSNNKVPRPIHMQTTPCATDCGCRSSRSVYTRAQQAQRKEVVAHPRTYRAYAPPAPHCLSRCLSTCPLLLTAHTPPPWTAGARSLTLCHK